MISHREKPQMRSSRKSSKRNPSPNGICRASTSAPMASPKRVCRMCKMRRWQFCAVQDGGRKHGWFCRRCRPDGCYACAPEPTPAPSPRSGDRAYRRRLIGKLVSKNEARAASLRDRVLARRNALLAPKTLRFGEIALVVHCPHAKFNASKSELQKYFLSAGYDVAMVTIENRKARRAIGCFNGQPTTLEVLRAATLVAQVALEGEDW